MFAKHFSDIFLFMSHPQTDNSYDTIEILNVPFQVNTPITLTSAGEVEHVLQKLNHKKSPGHDLITSIELPRKGMLCITNIFRLQYFPPSWKLTRILVIHT